MVFVSTRRETEVALQRVKWFPLAYGFRDNSTTNHLSVVSSQHHSENARGGVFSCRQNTIRRLYLLINPTSRMGRHYPYVRINFSSIPPHPPPKLFITKTENKAHLDISLYFNDWRFNAHYFPLLNRFGMPFFLLAMQPIHSCGVRPSNVCSGIMLMQHLL